MIFGTCRANLPYKPPAYKPAYKPALVVHVHDHYIQQQVVWCKF